MNYDVIVIGGGPGGYTAAIMAAKSRLKVALIEKDRLGGTCLNRGCIPTKALLHGANMMQTLKRFDDLGISVDRVAFDEEKLYEYKNRVVNQLNDGILNLVKANGIDHYHDFASFIDPYTVLLKNSGKTLTGTHTIIATGGRPAKLPLPGSDLSNVLTSDEVLDQPLTKDEILIVGGGVIGVELAFYYLATNRRVTILEMQKRILSTIDRELSNNVLATLKKKGVNVIMDALVERFEEQDDRIVCHYQSGGERKTLSAKTVLTLVGRKPNTDALNLEAAQVTTQKGMIRVNDRYQTNQPHIYAIGDVNGSVQLAHMAAAQAKDVVRIITNKEPLHRTSAISFCIYTKPEVAYVGLNMEEAEAKGISVRSAKYLMGSNGKHLIESDERGFIKVVFDETDTIVGAQLFMEKATELIGVFAMAIDNRLNYLQCIRTVFAHPTLSEGIGEAIENCHQEAVFVLPKPL